MNKNQKTMIVHRFEKEDIKQMIGFHSNASDSDIFKAVRQMQEDLKKNDMIVENPAEIYLWIKEFRDKT